MIILEGKDIREADLYTIVHEPVRSIDLMERASRALAEEILSAAGDSADYLVFAGKGNNGGDGLAVARLLHERNCDAGICVVCICSPDEMSEDCRANFDRLPSAVRLLSLENGKLQQEGTAVDCGSVCGKDTVVVDAILGTGLSGTVHGRAAEAIEFLNSIAGDCRCVISVDMPSGLPTEPAPTRSGLYGESSGVVRADITITVEFPKLSLLLPSTGEFAGQLRVVHIGLDRSFIESRKSMFEAVDGDYADSLRLPRPEFGHKGSFGHVLIIAGSTRYMGAAMLCTGAALRSGCGLVSAHIPVSGVQAMLVSHPSAIILPDPASCFSVVPDDLSRYSSILAGPGLGSAPETASAFSMLLQRLKKDTGKRTLVLDADALNMISSDPGLFSLVPEGTVLTPHIGELARLLRTAIDSGFITDEQKDAAEYAGEYPWRNDIHKISLVRRLCSRMNCITIVKGAHTMVCSPEGKCFFNMSGNPGMAKGGSGDVLAGLVAGLAARGHDSLSAAILGVWFHGVAGDKAATALGRESMNSADILSNIRI